MWLEEFMEGWNTLWLIYFIIAIIYWGGIAVGCAALAGRKGKDKITWGCLGLLLGVVALIMLAVTPPKKTRGE